MRIPDHLDWTTWRIVSSERLKAGLVEVETQWSLDDVWDAHEVLDLHEESEAKAAARAGRK